MPEIAAILPAYNEEVAIGSMVLRARKYADRVIVVDDGSTDHTAEVAEMAGAEVIRHPVNRGKGTALKMGLGPQMNLSLIRIRLVSRKAKKGPARIKLVSYLIFVNTINRGFGQRD